jgi:hypothetical protein
LDRRLILQRGSRYRVLSVTPGSGSFDTGDHQVGSAELELLLPTEVMAAAESTTAEPSDATVNAAMDAPDSDSGNNDSASDERLVYGDTVTEWRTMPWWPNGYPARIFAGIAGHDRELVVNIDGYDHDEQIPEFVGLVLASLLPESWMLENRGTRIEVHPSGHFAGGFNDVDIPVLTTALVKLGLTGCSVNWD